MEETAGTQQQGEGKILIDCPEKDLLFTAEESIVDRPERTYCCS